MPSWLPTFWPKAVKETKAKSTGGEEEIQDATPSSSTSDSEDGLKERGSSDGTEIVDVVFVHGLTGDALETWSSTPDNFWPTTLLQKKIPAIRIMTYGYNSAVVKLRGGVSQNTLSQHAQALAEELFLARQFDGTSKRPLIFVCHSLGGLLVEYIVSGLCPQRLHCIGEKTFAIAFFGTPHCGSSKADLAASLKLLVKPFNNNTRLLGALKQESEILFNVENRFYDFLYNPQGNKTVEICNFYEEFGYKQFGKIVPDTSSIMKGKPFFGIQADHVGIAKFASEEANGYKRVALVLGGWVKEVRAQQDEAIRHETELLNQAQAEVKARIHESRQLVERETRNGLMKILATSIGEHDIGADLEQASRKRCNGTMDWIFDVEDVHLWETEHHNAGLWINGGFGTGKSTIASRIIQRFRKPENSQSKKNVAFFFCKQKGNHAVLSSLAAQLLIMQKNITDKQTGIYKDWESSVTRINPEKRITDMIMLIKSFMANLLEVYFIIDGLDEHPDPNGILESLRDLYDYRPGEVRKYKWLFTSRPNQDLINGLNRFQNMRTVRLRDLRTGKVDQDIKTFAYSRLEEKLNSANLRVDRIVKNIVQKSEGCFLYASLLVGQMENQITPEEIIDCLNHDWGNGYEGLKSLYDSAWERCVNSNKYFKVLMLLVTFSMKPLRQSELEAAIQIELTPGPLESLSKPSNDIRKPIKGSLDHLCAPFVDISGDVKDLTFFLAHAKVKDYVFERENFYSEANGNQKLGEICLKYLTNRAFNETHTADELQNTEFQTRYPFLKYASIFWYKHLENVENPTEGLFNRVYDFWASKNFRTCIQIQSIYAPYHFAQFISRSYISDEPEINYADALPGWFAELNERGEAAALTYFNFVKDWGYYLRCHPGDLSGCMVGLIDDEIFCGGIAKEDSNTVAFSDPLKAFEAGTSDNGVSSQASGIPKRTIICIDDDRGMLLASYLGPQSKDDNTKVSLLLTQWKLTSPRQPTIQKKRVFTVDLCSSISIKPQFACDQHQSTCLTTMPLISGCPEVLVLILQGKMCCFSLKSKRHTNRSLFGFFRFWKTSSRAFNLLGEADDTNTLMQITACGETLAVAGRWDCADESLISVGKGKGIAVSQPRPGSSSTSPPDIKLEKGKMNTIFNILEEALAQERNEEETLEAIKSSVGNQGELYLLAALAVVDMIKDSDSDSDSDNDADDNSSSSDSSSSHSGTYGFSWNDRTRRAVGKLRRKNSMIPVCHKLAVFDVKKRSGKPKAEASFHHDHHDALITRSGVPILHPFQPLVAWYSGSDTVILMDFKTNKFQKLRVRPIPENDSDEFANDKVISCDIRFSACGIYLHTAIVCCRTEFCSSGTLTVTNQNLSSFRNNTGLVNGKSSVISTSVPWKLSQPRRGRSKLYSLQHAFTWTAKTLYVSFSNLTISVIKIPLLSKEKTSQPQIWAFGSGSSSRIHLPASMREVRVPYFPLGDGNAYVVPETQNFDPAVVVAVENPEWEEVGKEGVDFTTREEKGACEFYEASEESFVIPVRSGLVWTDRAVLNCQV